MQPRHPRLSSHADRAEPWRLTRLARVDGRVREIMRMLTRDPDGGTSAQGEVIWARHVTALHDDRGLLLTSVTHALAESPWLPVVAAVLARAWEGEDETEITFVLPDGRRLALLQVLWTPRGTEAPRTPP